MKTLSIGSQVRKYRNKKGWSLDELGKNAKLAKSTLSDIENDKAMPSIKALTRVSEALGIDIDQLFKQE